MAIGSMRATRPLIAVCDDTLAAITWAELTAQSGYESFFAVAFGSGREGFSPYSVVTDSLTNRPGSQIPACIVARADRGFIVVMQDQSSASQLLLKSFDSLGHADSQWPPTGAVLADTLALYPGGLAPVLACSDDSSGCLVLASGRIPIDLFHAKTAFILFRILRDGSKDPRWPREGVVLTTEGDEFNVSNALVPDGEGGAYAAWTTGNHSVSGLVRLIVQRVDRNGTVHAGWNPEGLEAFPSVVSAYQWRPQLLLDPGGRVAILTETDDGARRLKALDGNGATVAGWPDSGLVIGDVAATPAPGSSRMVGTGAGLAIAWSDSRLDPADPRETYMTAVSWLGDQLPPWPLGGIRLCANSNSQLIQGIAPASRSTVAVCWLRQPNEIVLGRFRSTDGTLDLGVDIRHSAYRVNGRIITTEWIVASPEQFSYYALRRIDDGPWTTIGLVGEPATGRLRFDDELPIRFRSLDYRIGLLMDGEVQAISDTLRVAAPSGAPLAVALDTVQHGHSLLAYLTTTIGGFLDIDVFDLLGRRIAGKRIGPVGAGSHFVEIPLRDAAEGVVFVRATNGRGVAVARAALVN